MALKKAPLGHKIRRLRQEREPHPAGAWPPARHLRELSQPDRARPAAGDGVAAVQAGRDPRRRSAGAVRQPSGSWPRPCTRCSPMPASAPPARTRGDRPAGRGGAQGRRAPSSRSIAPGAWRARTRGAANRPVRRPQAARRAAERGGARLLRDRANHFPTMEAAAEALGASRRGAGTGPRARRAPGDQTRHHRRDGAVERMDGALRRYDPRARLLTLSEALPRRAGIPAGLPARAARGARGDGPRDPGRRAVVARIRDAVPRRPGQLRRRRGADALCARSSPPRAALRHDIEGLLLASASPSNRRPAAVDAQPAGRARHSVLFRPRRIAGNVSKRFSAAGFHFSRYGGSCPRLGGAQGASPRRA